MHAFPSLGHVMSNAPISLTRFLIEEQQAGRINAELRQLVTIVARACTSIAIAVGKGALGGVLGEAGTGNVQGEAQKKLDVISNEILLEANAWGGHRPPAPPRKWTTASRCLPIPARRLPAAVRPAGRQLQHRRQRLGGHHLLGAARPAGTADIADEHFLQPGTEQVAAGYCIYGPSTMLVLTVGHGTHAFTLDRETGSFC
jgi:fructose-1,6-bisphosphatase I